MAPARDTVHRGNCDADAALDNVNIALGGIIALVAVRSPHVQRGRTRAGARGPILVLTCVLTTSTYDISSLPGLWELPVQPTERRHPGDAACAPSRGQKIQVPLGPVANGLTHARASLTQANALVSTSRRPRLFCERRTTTRADVRGLTVHTFSSMLQWRVFVACLRIPFHCSRWGSGAPFAIIESYERRVVASQAPCSLTLAGHSA